MLVIIAVELAIIALLLFEIVRVVIAVYDLLLKTDEIIRKVIDGVDSSLQQLVDVADFFYTRSSRT